MGNNLNEMDNNILSQGRDINVINKQIMVEKDVSTGIIIVILYLLSLACIVYGIMEKFYYIIPVGIIIPIWLFATLKSTESYFFQLEQRLQQSASQIDNYLEQRVIVLQNTAKIVERAIKLDENVFVELAKYRSGNFSDESRNEVQADLNKLYKGINVSLENYPDLKAHNELRDAMQQNLYLQREITAAREVYNDNVLIWNKEIFSWPFKKYIAGKNHYTTRIPFVASSDIKEKAKEVFF